MSSSFFMFFNHFNTSQGSFSNDNYTGLDALLTFHTVSFAGMRESEDNAIVICNALFLSELNYLLQGFAVMAARKATHRFGVKALFRRIAEG